MTSVFQTIITFHYAETALGPQHHFIRFLMIEINTQLFATSLSTSALSKTHFIKDIHIFSSFVGGSQNATLIKVCRENMLYLCKVQMTMKPHYATIVVILPRSCDISV